MKPLVVENNFFYQVQPTQVFQSVMVVVDSIALILILIMILHFYKNKDKIKVQEEDKILGKLLWYSHHDSKNDSRGLLASIGFLFLSVGFGFSLIINFVDTTLDLELIIILHITIIALMVGFALMFFFMTAQFSKPHLLIHEGGIKYRRPYSLLIPRKITFSKITGAKIMGLSPLYGSDFNRGYHRGLFIRFTHRKPMRFTTGWVEDVDRAASIIKSKATMVESPVECFYCGKKQRYLDWCKYCGEYYCKSCEEQLTLVHVNISCIACQHRKANKNVAMWLVPYVCIQCMFIVPMIAHGINPFIDNVFIIGFMRYFFGLYTFSNFSFAIIFLPYSLGLHAANAFRVAKIRKLKVKTSLLPFVFLSVMMGLSILFKVVYYIQGINSGLEFETFFAYLDLRFMIIITPLTFCFLHLWYRYIKYIIPILLLVIASLSVVSSLV